MDSQLQTIVLGSIFIWILIAVILVWALGLTEFSYMGKSGIQFLYNLFSKIYNFKWLSKSYSSAETTKKLFLDPLSQVLSKSQNSKMLDLACGTGRMSLMILNSNWFEGSIEAIDFSEGMLQVFNKKVSQLPSNKQKQIAIAKQDLSKWSTTEDIRFDAVTLTEAGEFLPNFIQIVETVSRITNPGALFLLTKPPDFMSLAYPGRAQSSNELKELFTKNGFTNIQIHKWTNRYEVVWAWKEIEDCEDKL